MYDTYHIPQCFTKYDDVWVGGQVICIIYMQVYVFVYMYDTIHYIKMYNTLPNMMMCGCGWADVCVMYLQVFS